MPRADMTPPRRPWATLRARMYIVSGPGVSQRRTLAARKAQRSCVPNITELESLLDGGPRSFDCRIRLSPCPQVFLRPEEVDGRSISVRNFASIVHSFPDPEHDAVSFRAHTAHRGRELQR